MCEVLEASVSGFYARRTRQPSQDSREDATLGQQVKAAFQASRQVDGSPRIHADLKAVGVACARKRVARLMREQDLSAKPPSHRTVTTKREKGAPVAANLLHQDFHAACPNQKWTRDTPSIWTPEGWV
jgi:putative transposase